MNGWYETTLSDICTDISYGYTASASNVPNGPKFLRITDIQGGFVDWHSVPYCPISASDYQKYRLQIGDICIARTGASTGTSTIIKSKVDAVFASYLIRYQIDRTQADPLFISYELLSEWYWQHVHSVMGGSAQPNANAKQLGSFRFRLPPLPIQQRIAEILGRLDDKIEVNRRINRTLESMAQALYQHWFVDFGPFQAGEFVESELGPIPVGWRVGKLGDLASVEKNTVDPQDLSLETPYIGLADMPKGSITLDMWGQAKDSTSTKFRMQAGQILFGKLRPYFKKVGVSPVDGVCSTDIYVVVPKQPEHYGIVTPKVKTTKGTK